MAEKHVFGALTNILRDFLLKFVITKFNKPLIEVFFVHLKCDMLIASSTQ